MAILITRNEFRVPSNLFLGKQRLSDHQRMDSTSDYAFSAFGGGVCTWNAVWFRPRHLIGSLVLKPRFDIG